MVRAYSIDLRKKGVSFIASGGGKREAAKVFSVGEDTIYRWLKREKAGDLSPKKRTEFPRKVDPQKLQEHVAKNPDHTLIEIAKAMNVGRQAVFTWLRRLGITRKKRPRSIKNVSKKNVQSFTVISQL